MSPTSIGFAFLLGILHVCSGKILELTACRLSAGWTSSWHEFLPFLRKAKIRVLSFFSIHAFTEQVLHKLPTVSQKYLCPV